MSGFEPRISVVGSDRSTNWATTTAQDVKLLFVQNFIDYSDIILRLSQNKKIWVWKILFWVLDLIKIASLKITTWDQNYKNFYEVQNFNVAFKTI